MAYNTTPFHGKVCRVEKNTVVMDFSRGWSLTVALDMTDSSRQGQNWKEGLPGQAGWSGSFEAYFVPGNTEQKAFVDNLITAAPGTKLTDVQFNLDLTTSALIGNIYITGFSINASISGTVSYTMNFVGDGALSISATA